MSVEEQGISMASQAVARIAQFGISVPVTTAAILEGPNSALYQWLAAGNEVDTSFKVPRALLPEFEQAMNAAGYPFSVLDKDAHTEYATVATRGPGEYVVENSGEYEKTNDGRRIANPFADEDRLGDRKGVASIIQSIDREYEKIKTEDYRLTIDKANEKFLGKETSAVKNMTLEEASLFQDICSENFVHSLIRIDPGTRTYMVEFLNEEALKDTFTGLSPVEMSLQKTLMVQARPEVKEWLDMSHKTNENIKNYLIDIRNPEIAEVKPMVIIPAGDNRFDELNGRLCTQMIEISADKKATIIDHRDFDHRSVTFYDLTDKEEFEKFLVDCSAMEQKYFMPKVEFDLAANDVTEFNKYIATNDEKYKLYLSGVEAGKYEAERLSDNEIWKTKFEDKKLKDHQILRTIECRIPDSEKIVNILDKESIDEDQTARQILRYNLINANIEEAKNRLVIASPAKYVATNNAFYQTAAEVAIAQRAAEVGFDLEHATEEEIDAFYAEQFEPDKDYDGIDDHEDSVIDKNRDGIDDREQLKTVEPEEEQEEMPEEELSEPEEDDDLGNMWD